MMFIIFVIKKMIKIKKNNLYSVQLKEVKSADKPKVDSKKKKEAPPAPPPKPKVPKDITEAVKVIFLKFLRFHFVKKK